MWPFFIEDITKFSNEVYNKLANTSAQQIFIAATGYTFRPVNCWRPDDDLLTGRNM